MALFGRRELVRSRVTGAERDVLVRYPPRGTAMFGSPVLAALWLGGTLTFIIAGGIVRGPLPPALWAAGVVLVAVGLGQGVVSLVRAGQGERGYTGTVIAKQWRQPMSGEGFGYLAVDDGTRDQVTAFVVDRFWYADYQLGQRVVVRTGADRRRLARISRARAELPESKLTDTA